MLKEIQGFLKGKKINALLFVNAYLVLAIFNLFNLPVETLFIKLTPTTPLLLSILLIVLGVVAQVSVQEIIPLNLTKTFVIIFSSYIFLTIFKSPSILIVLGFLAVALAVYAKLSWDKAPWRNLVALISLLTFPKVIHLLMNPATIDLKRFVIKNEEWNINQLWILLIAMFYAFFTYILIKQLNLKWLEQSKNNKTFYRILYIIVLTFAFIFIIFISVTAVYKVKTFSVSSFDIGIFTQMFESMKRDFTQLTTLERDKLMSHFGVHISPIYYLLLPFYMLLPYGETLEVLQILVVFSGLIPFSLILKKLNLPQFIRPLALLWFVVTPSMTTAGSYHIHENCFLVPLLLWIIYGTISQWRGRLGLAVLLTLMIKEDAFIYVFAIGLFFLLQSRFELSKKTKYFIGASQIIFPIVYFSFCLYILSRFGEGGMVARFDNFLLPGQVGLLKVLRNIFLNPTYTLASFFTQRKLMYIFVLLLTQAFLPLFQKYWANYILLMPLVVINLLSDWPYQVDIGFQYSYGTLTLVLFMSLLALENFADRKTIQIEKNNKTLLSLVAIALIFSTGVLYQNIHGWHGDMLIYYNDQKRFDGTQTALDKIPRNKRVLSFHSYTVALRSVPDLYDLFYHNEKKFDKKVDLLVVPRSAKEAKDTAEAKVIALYTDNGYKESDLSNEYVLVLEKP